MMRLVLASGSPRRRELMKLITNDFDVRVSEADENIQENLPADKTAEYLSMVKAKSVHCGENEIVIGCDTVVVIDGKVMGKPANEEHCREMLKLLSGSIHSVYTGVSLVQSSAICSFTTETKVQFYSLTEKEIIDYIATGEPFDKAGGYGIQGKGALLVKCIEGDFFNVVGLPVSALKRKLEKFGQGEYL